MRFFINAAAASTFKSRYLLYNTSLIVIITKLKLAHVKLWSLTSYLKIPQARIPVCVCVCVWTCLRCENESPRKQPHFLAVFITIELVRFLRVRWWMNHPHVPYMFYNRASSTTDCRNRKTGSCCDFNLLNYSQTSCFTLLQSVFCGKNHPVIMFTFIF